MGDVYGRVSVVYTVAKKGERLVATKKHFELSGVYAGEIFMFACVCLVPVPVSTCNDVNISMYHLCHVMYVNKSCMHAA